MFSVRRFIFDAFLPAICVLGVAYNFLIALNGDEGVRAHAIVLDELAESQADLGELRAHRQALEQKVELLSLKSLDDDMLDESARRVLGYAAKGEKVVPAQEFDQLIKQMQKQNP